MIVVAGAVAAVVLLIFEWRRRDRRRRLARVAATLLAVAALVVWRLLPERSEAAPRKAPAAAVLWTSAANPNAELTEQTSAAYHFKLPGVDMKTGDAAVIPDLAFLRRQYPEINRLRVVGDGVEAFELDALRGMQVSLGEDGCAVDQPAISSLHAPREVAVGEQIEIHGRVAGLKAGEKVRVIAEGPDGAEKTSVVNADGEQVFALSSPALAAEGRFVWRLKVTRDDQERSVLADERIGIAVTAPKLPRVLVLESSPNLETAHLQRWLTQSGGAVNARTLVGEGRYRFAAAEFSNVDAGLLAEFDVVITDARALAALRPEEAEAVRVAVKEEGLGLLIMPRGEGALPNEFAAWKLTHGAGEIESDRRSARLVWRGLAEPIETPVAIENAAIEIDTPRAGLVTDSRGALLVDAIRRGRGEIALSLVRDTWQWRLQNQSPTFARYWSFLLGRLAKPQVANGWRLANAAGAPLVVNQPTELVYTSIAGSLGPGEIRVAGDDQPITVPLAQDLAEPQRWRTTFWPRAAGWHHVVAPDTGARLDFFVHDAGEWAGLRAENRRLATERFAALSKESPDVVSDVETRGVTTAGAWACFAVFLLSSSYLWFERRTATRRDL